MSKLHPSTKGRMMTGFAAQRCRFGGITGILAKVIALLAVVAGLLSRAGSLANAQGGGWSRPVMLSTNTANSWWSDVAVDPAGRAYVVWMSGQAGLDLLMYSAWDGQTWSEPKDIIVTARGGFTIRPALAINASNVLHVTYRSYNSIFHASAPAGTAGDAASWTAGHRLSGSGNGYYSDVAIDSSGVIHVVWNEAVPVSSGEPAVWVGGTGGLSRYDGRQWQADQALEDLAGGEIYVIWEDASGVDWFGTANGVFRSDGATWEALTTKDGLADSRVYAIRQDSDGVMWFGTAKGVSSYDSRSSGRKWLTYAQRDGLAGDRVTAIAVFEGRVLWFGTTEGLSRYDGRSWVTFSVADGLVSKVVTALATDSRGTLWIGTDKGLSRYDGQTWVTFTSANGLADSYITALAVGKDDDLWVGTWGGVSHYGDGQWKTFGVSDGMPDKRVTALDIDTRGRVWVGTERGVSSYDGQTWRVFTTRDGLADDRVAVISEDKVANAVCPNCADVFYRHSTDGGATWSEPVNLSNSFPGSVKPQIRIDHQDRIHVVWEEGEDWYVSAGKPIGSAYVHSLDGGATWSQPAIFMGAEGAVQQITLGVGRDDDLIVVWRYAGHDQFYYQRSVDSGNSWSAPAPISGVMAKAWSSFSLDSCSAATDSGGHVHVLVIGRFSDREEALSVVHLEWDGAQWLAPTRVFASTDPPEWPRIAIGGGNRVFGTWFTRDQEHVWDTAHGRYQVWAASMQSSAPAVTPVPVASRATGPVATVEAVSSPTSAPTPVVSLTDSGLPGGLRTETDELVHMAIALVPLIAIVLALVSVRMGWIRRVLDWFASRR